jgi:hypothetical protein
MMKEKYERGEIDCEGDIKRKSSNGKIKKMTDIEKAKKSDNTKNIKEQDCDKDDDIMNKTIESVDEIDLF